MDKDTCKSIGEINKKRVYSIAKPYATWAVTLPETEPVVDQTGSLHVIDDRDGNAIVVDVGEPVQGLPG